MKTRHSQSGHSLLVHLFHLALVVIIILFLIYACSGPTEQVSSTRMSRSQPSSVRNTLPSAPSAPRPASPQLFIPPPAVNIGVSSNAAVSALPSAVSGATTNEGIVIARQTMPRSAPPQPEPPLPTDASAAAAAPAQSAKVTTVKTTRVVRPVGKQPQSVGRMIIIATVIALAVIIFWFVHSNVMYKRTLRAVAAAQTRKEEEETAPPTGEEGGPVVSLAPAPTQQTAEATAASQPAVAEQTAAAPAAAEGAELPPPSPQSSVVDRLVWLKHLYDNGLISQADYDTKKKEILAYI
ncbi:MAG: SHOCT domain-containing protein [bacterium]